MTYHDLLRNLNALTPEQLGQDVSVAILSSGGVEVFGTCDFVDPLDSHLHENQDARDSVYLDEINDCILDAGHPYMTVVTG